MGVGSRLGDEDLPDAGGVGEGLDDGLSALGEEQPGGVAPGPPGELARRDDAGRPLGQQ
jgi:hypothetical protein